MQKFSAKISTNGRVVAVGWVWNKLAETFQKIGNGFETLHLDELLWPPIGQRFGKVFSVKKNKLRGHIVKNIETAGFEAAWEVTHICFAIFLCFSDLKDYRLYVFLSRKG